MAGKLPEWKLKVGHQKSTCPDNLRGVWFSLSGEKHPMQLSKPPEIFVRRTL
jgi:hypothetical protein